MYNNYRCAHNDLKYFLETDRIICLTCGECFTKEEHVCPPYPVSYEPIKQDPPIIT